MKFFESINLSFLLLGVLVGFCIFLRWYQIEERNQFTWDQVDNAWAAKTILVDKKFPTEGMQAKLNSGLFIGPLYYYYITPFYWAFNLDPVASGYIAVSSSVISLLILYLITKSIFSYKVAMIASFVYVFCLPFIEFDRIQWPVNFVPAASLIIFYSVYKILNNSLRHFFLLMLALGLSFHLHMSSVFYIIIFLLCLPFLPRRKETVKYFLYSFPIFFILVSPIFYRLIGANQLSTGSSYASSSYHGFHIRRILQLRNDAFLEYAMLFETIKINLLRFMLPVLFLCVYLRENLGRERLIFGYLFLLWFLVPWILLSSYSGELTAYYFIIPRFLAVMTASYLISKLIFSKNTFVSLLSAAIFGSYLLYNLFLFFEAEYQGISYHRERTLKRIQRGEEIEFKHGTPGPYFYYIYTRNEKR